MSLLMWAIIAVIIAPNMNPQQNPSSKNRTSFDLVQFLHIVEDGRSETTTVESFLACISNGFDGILSKRWTQVTLQLHFSLMSDKAMRWQ